MLSVQIELLLCERGDPEHGVDSAAFILNTARSRKVQREDF